MEEVKIVACNSLERLVDLVGIEPTISSMPWNSNGSRRLILKWLATGRLVKIGYIGRYFRPISGQKFQQVKQLSCMGGGSVACGFPTRCRTNLPV
jgi:hypothetical protein